MQLAKDAVQVANILHIHGLLLVGSDCRPTRFGPVAVVIPLQEGDLIVAKDVIQKSEHIITNICSRKVQHQLVSLFRPWPPCKVQYPIGMLPI